jgi:DNA repair protein RadC
LGVLHGWEIVRTTTSRQDAGPRTLRDFDTIMIVHEASLNFQLIRYGDDEPLTTTKRLLAYLTDGVADDPHECFWIVCMNPKRRPICRMRMAAGLCVAATIGVRQVIRAMILSDAMAVACLRTERASVPQPNLADDRLLWTLRETTRLMNMELVDYLVARLDSPAYHSWREHDQSAV